MKSETYEDMRDFNIIDDYTPINRYLDCCYFVRYLVWYYCCSALEADVCL